MYVEPEDLGAAGEADFQRWSPARDFHSLPGEGISGGSRSGRKPQRFEKLSA